MPLLLATALAAATATAPQMDHRAMPGMTMAAKPKPAPKPAPKRKPADAKHRGPAKPPAPKAPPSHPAAHEAGTPAHGMGDMPMPGMDHGQTAPPARGNDPHQGHAMPAMPHMATKPVADGRPAPAPPRDHAADGIWGADDMQASRRALRDEHGGSHYSMLLFNLAELKVRDGREGYAWDAEGWTGGDTDRLVIRSEGEGTLGGAVERAEVQLLYSRAIGPYWNVQGGVRHDLRPGPARTYLSAGLEGLAPNNFDLEGFAFLSDKGDLLGRLEGWYDQRVTQRLILQPRVEANLSAQAMPRQGVGAGLVDAELALRLRYEVRREFAPYIGIGWERRFGATARMARAQGDGTGGFALLAGVRTWF